MLAREFARNHDVLVISFKRMYPSLLFPGKTQFDESGDPIAVESRRVIDTMNPFSFWQAAKVIARFKPDIVIFQWWQPFLAVTYWAVATLVKRFTSARLVYICHNVLPHESSFVDRMLIKIAFRPVSSFLVHSREDRDNLLTLKDDPVVSVHPLPIYSMFMRGNYSSATARKELGLDGHVLLFFGLVRRYKGLDTLLEGFAKSLECAKSTLVIVGEFYEDRQQYISQIERLGIGNDVVIVDRYVSNEEVEKYFAACEAVVLPYRSATQSAIVQVAYSFDRAVIVTRVGGLPDVVEDGVSGYIVPPNDPAALADAICRMLEGDTYERMQRNIPGIKERFSWERCMQALVDLAQGARDK
jgi:glycosyltransferase involved in cell wall biosynthesis